MEGLVGFARRTYMVPLPEAKNLEELNGKILADCLAYGSHKMAGRSESVAELFEKEKEHLLDPPEIAFSNIRLGDARVDKYATVMIGKNRYSVPWKYTGRRLKLLIHVDRVEIFADGKRLAVHQRLFANNQWSLAPEHCLELIQQRPMSFASARVIRQWREHWPQSLHTLLANFCRIQGETKAQVVNFRLSFVNMAEIELSALKGQCLDRRIADLSTMQAEVVTWQRHRNNASRTIDWQFSTPDAPIKLKRLYPKL